VPPGELTTAVGLLVVLLVLLLLLVRLPFALPDAPVRPGAAADGEPSTACGWAMLGP